MTSPESCNSMAELRALIDELDGEIIRLLARRAACIDRAIELKQKDGLPARIGERVEEVAANARKNAEAAGLDPEFTETLWRQLIEWSIAREERAMGRGAA